MDVEKGHKSNLEEVVAVRATWPTPTASQARSEGMIMQLRALLDAGTLTREEAEAMAQGSLTPPRMKPWPTPTVCGNYNRAGLTAKSGDGLATAVQKWPTPIASDSRGSSGGPAPGKQTQLVDAVRFATPLARDWRSGKASQATHDKNSRPLSEQIGGSLNPTWVEWLMGWPLGWTDLEPLATDRCPSVLQLHGGS
jgi:hypothetical protein